MARLGNFLVLSFASAAFAAAVPERLDQFQIHKAYEDGDFDDVVQRLDAFRKAHPSYSQSDSVFIAKHLAVVYAANPQTVEVAKYWIYQLLKLMPAADLIGMYVNEEIERLFEKVRKEFLSKQTAFGVDTAGVVLPRRPALDTLKTVERESPPHPSASIAPPRVESAKTPTGGGPAPASAHGGSWVWWTSGGAVAALAAGAAFWYAEQEPPPKSPPPRIYAFDASAP